MDDFLHYYKIYVYIHADKLFEKKNIQQAKNKSFTWVCIDSTFVRVFCKTLEPLYIKGLRF